MVRRHVDGALLGLAVGDALGATLEFSTPRCPSYPTLVTGPHREMTGGGPHRVAPGQVTDDTQMAICLLRALTNEPLTVETIAGEYARWIPHAFDAGNQTRAALAYVRDGLAPLEAGRRAWEDSGRRAAGNGSLMRTAPIGVVFANHPEGRRYWSATDSKVTHADPRCVEACVAFNAAIAAGVRGEPDRMFACAREELTHVELLEDLDAAMLDDPQLDLYTFQGFVRVAFRLAFWHLLHVDSFEASMIDIVNRGGDSDTNAAITGALLGARLGVEAIPRRWRDAVLSATPVDPVMASTYHPRTLVAGALV